MNWNNLSLIILGLTAFLSAFIVALWVSLVIWTFRDMRARSRDAFAQLLAALMILVLGPLGMILYFMLRPRETLAEKYERSLEEEALLQDIEERQICPGCKQPIEPDFVVCPICNVRLRTPCVHCGRLIHPRWGLCPYCGESQKPVPGLEQAGTVTLLDLEEEEAVSAIALEDGSLSIESLEAEAMSHVVGAGSEDAADWEWEADEAEATDEEGLADLFPDDEGAHPGPVTPDSEQVSSEPFPDVPETPDWIEDDGLEPFSHTDGAEEPDEPSEPDEDAEDGTDADKPSGGIRSLFKQR